ncbi:MAG TPA: molybdenum cofactor guanylyltransferase [Bryobacteraceae bacterium]|nr:molybdenum cofactor guanylyltransferase [Bryobacteraceae bacterium]
MRALGYVLAGGQSTRMGRDKALLSYRGATLVEHVARVVEGALDAAQTGAAVTILGDPVRYSQLGFPVQADLVAGCGPIGGIFTALSLSPCDWNLIVACDMPNLSSAGLRTLLACSRHSAANCLVASGAGAEPEPLCGVYHRRCLAALDRAIRGKRFRMKNLVRELEAEIVPLDGPVLANVNTPDEWLRFDGQPG